MLTIRANLLSHNSLPRFHNPHTPFHHPISITLRNTKLENQTHFRLYARSISNNSAPPPGGNSNNNRVSDDWEDNNEAKYETPKYNCKPNGYMDMTLNKIDIKTVVSVGSALLKKIWTNICEHLEQISIWTAVVIVAAGCTIAAAAAAVLVFFIFALL